MKYKIKLQLFKLLSFLFPERFTLKSIPHRSQIDWEYFKVIKTDKGSLTQFYRLDKDTYVCWINN